MKTKVRLPKRLFGFALACVFLFSGVFGACPVFTAGNLRAYASGTVFTVPETIYTAPSVGSGSSQMQYFLNVNQDGSVPLGYETTGRVYFSNPSASGVQITCSDAGVTLSQSSGAGTVNATIGGALQGAPSPGSTRMLQWTATFTENGVTKTVRTYSVVYAPYPYAAAAVAGANAYKASTRVSASCSTVIFGVQQIDSSGLQSVTLPMSRSSGSSMHNGSGPYRYMLPAAQQTPACYDGSTAPGSGDLLGSSGPAGMRFGFVTDRTNTRETLVIGGLGKVYFDNSRANRVGHIPNLTMRSYLNGAYCDDSFSSHAENFEAQAGFYVSCNGASPSGTVYWSDTAKTTDTVCVPAADLSNVCLSDQQTMLYGCVMRSWRARGTLGTSDSVYASAITACSFIGTDKSSVRALYQNEISQARQCGDDQQIWADYQNAMVQAANYLGNPMATSFDTTTLTNAITALENSTSNTNNRTFVRGDQILFGRYPQSRVTDADTLTALEAAAPQTWLSYGYYSGTGSNADGQMTASDYMQYCDVTLGGQQYRGVRFTQYRPVWAGYESTIDHSHQDENGYRLGTYWFRWEPMLWRVLDPSTGLVLSEMLIDGQMFNTYLLLDETSQMYYGDANKTYYANNYAQSTIRAWLTNGSDSASFLNTAFTAAERAVIANTPLNNDAYSTASAVYNSVSTTDKVFLPAWSEMLNTAYGFSAANAFEDTARQARYTEYAKCQGVQNGRFGAYLLRSAGDRSQYATTVDCYGYANVGFNTAQIYGVRPAMRINLQSALVQIPDTASITYTLTLQPDGGTWSDGTTANRTITQTTGTTTQLPTDITKTGYTFYKWRRSANASGGTKILGTYTFSTTDETLTAQWTGNTYMLTLNPNGGTWSDGATTDKTVYRAIDMTYTLPTNLSKAGCTFGGWQRADGSTLTGTYTYGASDETLTAQWTPNTYTVTFRPTGGAFEDDGGFETGLIAQMKPVDFGSTFGAANGGKTWPTVTRTGYTFCGWNTTEEGSGTAIAANTVFDYTSNVQLYAQWMLNTYIVTFKPLGGTFAADGGFAAGTAEQTKNVTYGSAYSAANGGKTWPTVTRAGYVFGGWNTAANGSGSMIGENTVFSGAGDVTLYARWTANVSCIIFNPCSGTFAAAGGFSAGTASQSKDVAYGSTFGTANGGKTWPTVTRTGYAFGGWNTTADGSGTTISETDTVTVTQNLYVYARWTPNTYTVTFRPTGGTFTTDGGFGSGTLAQTKSVTFGSTYGAANGGKTWPTVTRSGFTFCGWYMTSDGSGSEIDANAVFARTSNVDLYAKWTLSTYVVTFKPTGGAFTADGGFAAGTAAQTKNVTFGSAYSAENGGKTWPTVTRTGYTFDGWNTASDGSGTVIGANTIFNGTGDVTLYARWTANVFCVTFNPCGGTFAADGGFSAGTAPQTKNVVYGSTFGAANGGKTWPTVTRAGYAFDGWNTMSNGAGTTISETDTVTITQNPNVYALWTANTYTVLFRPNGGSFAADGGFTAGTASQTKNVTFGSTYGAASGGKTWPTVTRTGYIFEGWNTSPNGFGSRVDANTVYSNTGNSTLTAQWTENLYILTFDPCGGMFSAEGGFAAGTSPENKYVSGTGTYGDVNNGRTWPTVTRADYVFAGWNTAADGSGTAVCDTDAVTITQDTTVFAQWTATYTVTFDPNGGDFDAAGGFAAGNTPQIKSVNDGDTYGAASEGMTWPTVTRYGYSPAGWNTAADGSGTAVAQTDTVTQHVTIFAQWTANTFTVTFDPCGGTFTSSGGFAAVSAPQTKTVAFGSTYGAASGGKTWPTVTRTGFAFDGWYLNGVQTHDTDIVLLSQNCILHANWMLQLYTVTFDANGGAFEEAGGFAAGTAAQTKSVAFGDTYGGANSGKTWPTVTRAGYLIGTWNTAADGSGTTVIPTDVMNTAGSVTLYAQWKSAAYTITFDPNGGSFAAAGGFTAGTVLQTKTVLGGSAYGASDGGKTWPTVTRTGYTFGGWFMNGGTLIQATDTVTITQSTTVQAQWTAIPYTLTLDPNGGVFSDGSTIPAVRTGMIGTQCTLPTVTRAGYTFDGWFDADGTASGSVYTFPAADETLTAQWTAIPYTLTFDPNGGSFAADSGFTAGTASQTKNVTFGSTYGAASGGKTWPTVTRTGYTFGGWFMNGGTLIQATDTVTITQSTTAQAQWTAIPYTLTLDPNGGVFSDGSTIPAVRTGMIGTQCTLPTVMRVGYTFDGWFDTNGTAYGSTTYTFPAANTTLTAQWTAIPYTLTFDPNGGGFTAVDGFAAGTAAESKIVFFGSAYGASDGGKTWPTVTRTGYTFGGWFMNGGTLIQATDTVTITQSTTVQAQWTAIPYTLTLDPNGGAFPDDSTDPVSQTGTIGVQFTLPTVTRAGYTFDGWFDADGTASGSVYTFPAADETLTAQWTAIPYTLTLDPNGGTFPDGGTVSVTVQGIIDGIYTPPASMTCAGKVFYGWDLTGVGTYADGDFTFGAGDATLTAIWKRPGRLTLSYPNTCNGPGGCGRPLSPGALVPVTVTLHDNPGLISMMLLLHYDQTQLDLVQVEDLGLFSGGVPDVLMSAHPDLTGMPYRVCWADTNGATTQNYTDNGDLVIFWFRVRLSAQVGLSPIWLEYDQDNTFDVHLDDVVLAPGSIDLPICALIGDMDGDGRVNVWDSICLNAYLNDPASHPIAYANADLNGDSVVDANDLTYLNQYIVGGYGCTAGTVITP